MLLESTLQSLQMYYKVKSAHRNILEELFSVMIDNTGIAFHASTLLITDEDHNAGSADSISNALNWYLTR